MSLLMKLIPHRFRASWLLSIALAWPVMAQGPVDSTSAMVAGAVGRGSLRGVLMPVSDLPLSSRASGVIEKFGADEGERVVGGDVLVQLNAEVERAELARAKAVLESMNVEWEHTRRELDRQSMLFLDESLSIGSRKEFENVKYAHELATARRKQAEAEIMVARARLDERSIVAPPGFNGLLFKRSRSIGEAVERLEPVVRIIDASKLELVVYGGANLIGKFAVGKPAQIKIEEGPARGGVVMARVIYVDPVLDAHTGTSRIRLQVEPSDEVQPGISVSLQVPSEVHR
jgi:membrane fusion protein, multidrug efflux system